MKQGLTIASLVGAAALAHNVMGLGEEARRRSAAPPADNARPVPQAHEAPAHDPWMPRRATAPEGVIEHCGPWVRDAFASIQVNVDHRGCNIVGDAANEPSIAIDPTDPRKMVIGWRQFDTVESDFRQAGWGYSHDAGHTWVFPGSLTPGVFGSDPVLGADPDGVFFYVSINFDEMRVFRSFDHGVTWSPPIHVVPGLADKPWMTIDQTNGMGRGNIYIAWASGTNGFARSTDRGASFGASDVVGTHWGTLCVAADGTLYITGGRQGSGDTVGLVKSDNAQDPSAAATFSPVVYVDLGGPLVLGTGPNPDGLLGQVWGATDHSQTETRGNVYLLASILRSFDDLIDVMFSRSTDGGVTWSEKIRVNDDPKGNEAWQWFAMMSVAPNGRIDAVWNDTRNYLEAPAANLSELFYAYSEDAGVTWSANTPVSPVFDSWVGWPHQHKIGTTTT